jgi:PAS domain S-box-containing protein
LLGERCNNRSLVDAKILSFKADQSNKTDQGSFSAQILTQNLDLFSPATSGYGFSVEGGDWTYAVYGAANIISNLLIAGAPFSEIEAEAQAYLRFLKDKATVGLNSFFLPGGYCALLNLQGKTASRESFDCEYLDEAGFLKTLGQLSIVEGWFYAVKLRSLFLFRCFDEGVKVVAKAEVVAIGVPGQVKVPEAYFYSCLMIAAAHQPTTHSEVMVQNWILFEKYLGQMKIWSDNCPENFLHKYHLIRAEKSRVENEPLEKTLALYDAAIESAKANGYCNNEALARELKGRYWLAQGHTSYAIGDLTEAMQGYSQWGATEKVLMLEQEISGLAPAKSKQISSTIRSLTEVGLGRLELMSVYKASRVISGELVLTDLLEKLIRIVMEHTGAQRGYLLLLKDDELSVGVEANVNSGQGLRVSHQTATEMSLLPQSILNYVKRTHEKVALDDASEINMFSSDMYLIQNKLKSVLCLPLLKQSKIIGMIYLENNLITGTFANDRLAVVEILLGQIIISLENAALFSELGRKVSQLEESDKQFRSLADSMPQLAWTAHPDGFIFWYNEGWCKYTGTSPLTTKGWSWESVHDPLELPRVVEAWRDSIATGKQFEMEFPLRGADGEFRWFLTRAVPVRDSEGKITRWFGTNTNIDSQRKAERERSQLMASAQAAQEASKMKSEFLANMSHEIRTPINGIVGMTGLIADTELDQDQRSYVDAITQSADSLLTVINDILDFSKIEAGKLDFEELEFDLVQMVEDTILALGILAQKKNIALIVDLDKDLPRSLKGDPGRLRQIFNNLVGNAIKFTPKGKITLRASVVTISSEIAEIKFEVEDTGVGIPERLRTRLFQAFSQADASTSRKFGGTGLGLSISKHLVERLGGQIGVQSEEGRGSTFWFTIALKVGVSSATKVVRLKGIPNVAEALGRSARILIAEDNAINQKIALRLLEKMGLKADAVGNGFEAVAALQNISYDLVLMDCQMPDMDGYEATALIRKSKPLPFCDVPIIAMTANAIKGDRERCLSAGMNDYLSKPVQPGDLATVILKWLESGPTPVEKASISIDKAPSAKLIDRDILAELMELDAGNGEAFIKDLIETFLVATPKFIFDMRMGLENKDLKRVAGEAHQLKSTAGYLGATSLAMLAIKLERHAASGDVAEISVILNETETLFELVKLELGSIVNSKTTMVS